MIAEIPESDASGALALCYADIRRRLGVPVVNLIWRHLAALGEIEACWERARANLARIERDAAGLNAAARELAAGLAPLCSLPWSDPGPAILLSYERGNSLNLAMVRLLLGRPPPEAGGRLPQAPTSLPPVPRFADLPASSREAVERLAAAGPGAATGVRPTLWVHLACTPALLAAAAESLPAILADERFRDAHHQLTAPADPAGGHGLTETAAAALARFNLRIGEMLLIGLHLDRSRLKFPETNP
jgi:hypothetical protein